jgi:hypothetical protein
VNEKIEFEIDYLDRANIKKIKHSFGLRTDEQVILFSLQTLAQNIAVIKGKLASDRVKSNKEVQQPKASETDNSLEGIKEENGGKND